MKSFGVEYLSYTSSYLSAGRTSLPDLVTYAGGWLLLVSCNSVVESGSTFVVVSDVSS